MIIFIVRLVYFYFSFFRVYLFKWSGGVGLYLYFVEVFFKRILRVICFGFGKGVGRGELLGSRYVILGKVFVLVLWL